MKLKENVKLAPLTTFKAGGAARYFVEARNKEDLKKALSLAKSKRWPLFILGGGSNILISDKGFPGLVIKISLRGITHEKIGEDVYITAAAGEVWDDFVKYAVTRGWRGVENLSGVPGTVGAAPVQNIGCYGSEVRDTIESVVVFDTEDCQTKSFSTEECQFAYRSSLFRRQEGGKYIVLSVTFRLSSTPYPEITEAYVDNRFDIWKLVKERSGSPTPEDVRAVILRVREEKGMIIMDGRESYNSAGSFFKAPVVSKESFERIRKIALRVDEEKETRLRPWFWEMGETSENAIKIAPAFLLEFTEFNKGYRRGRVGISPKHSLSLINLGGATASEIYNLARDMQESARKIFDVKLETEIILVGDF